MSITVDLHWSVIVPAVSLTFSNLHKIHLNRLIVTENEYLLYVCPEYFVMAIHLKYEHTERESERSSQNETELWPFSPLYTSL